MPSSHRSRNPFVAILVFLYENAHESSASIVPFVPCYFLHTTIGQRESLHRSGTEVMYHGQTNDCGIAFVCGGSFYGLFFQYHH